MRSDFVVGLAEAVEDALLQVEVRSGWFRHLGFEGLVHSLVGSVLLWAAWGDPLMCNAELKPPDIELAEPVNSG